MAALVGIAIAQFWPAPPSPDAPLVERLMQGTRSLWQEAEQIPATLGLAPPSVSPPAASPPPASSPTSAATAQPTAEPMVPPPTSTLSSRDTLKVTLPTDALFSQGQTTLQAGSEAVLDSLLADLQRYPGATIRVGAHSDKQAADPADPAGDRARTFEQATAVEQYLSSKLGEDYRWTVTGYGASQPLADNSTPVNRQRNRRIELVIEPR